MIEASFASPMGSWSPYSIVANFGNMLDRLADVPPSGDDGLTAVGASAGVGAPTSAGAAFERALAEELRRAGDIDPFNGGSHLQNGVVLSKAGENQAPSGRPERLDAASASHIEAAEQIARTALHRRVGFDGDDSTSRSSADNGDRFDRATDRHDPAAFWAGDRVATHPLFQNLGSSIGDEPFVEPVPTGRVFFNGDGRPILLPSIDDRHGDDRVVADTSSDGDLMILPNGAVLAYDPWTTSVDGPLEEGAATH